MTVDIDTAAIEALFHDPAGPIGQIMESKTYAVENAARRLLLQGGSGRLYTTRFWRDKEGRLRVGRPRPPHRASAPGAPPASDTGNLLAHIGHRMEDGASGIEGVVYDDALYAEYLELGTRDMAPRPYLRPALDIGLKG